LGINCIFLFSLHFLHFPPFSLNCSVSFTHSHTHTHINTQCKKGVQFTGIAPCLFSGGGGKRGGLFIVRCSPCCFCCCYCFCLYFFYCCCLIKNADVFVMHKSFYFTFSQFAFDFCFFEIRVANSHTHTLNSSVCLKIKYTRTIVRVLVEILQYLINFIYFTQNYLPITGRKIVLQHSRRTNTHTHMHFGQLFFVHLLDETQTKRK